MEKIYTFFQTELFQMQNVKLLIFTFLIYTVSLVVKSLIQKSITKNESLNALEKASFKRNIGLYSNLIVFLMVSILWFSQIQSFVVSLVAVAAAFVLATKELIMTITGGLTIHLNGHFKVGDRIEIDKIRGFVVEKRLMVTKVLEIGPDKYSQQTTGNLITVPNSIILNQAVINQSYFANYSIKSYSFKFIEGKSFIELEEKLLTWANEICAPYLKDAAKMISKFCNREGLLIPQIHPRVKIVRNDDKDFEVLLKMPVRNQEIGDVEQKLYRLYIEFSEAKKPSGS